MAGHSDCRDPTALRLSRGPAGQPESPALKQPLRFVSLPEDQRETLDANLKSFLGEAANSASAGS